MLLLTFAVISLTAAQSAIRYIDHCTKTSNITDPGHTYDEIIVGMLSIADCAKFCIYDTECKYLSIIEHT